MTGLTDNQFEVLWQLSDTEWLKPLDFGAWDASHHSGTARRMVKKGWVEMSGYQSYQRRVNKYRRTPAGREVYLKEKVRRQREQGFLK